MVSCTRLLTGSRTTLDSNCVVPGNFHTLTIHGKSLEIPNGSQKVFKVKYKAKLEFPEEGGA